MTDTFATIRYERNEGVGTLTLARPEKRNAVSPTMLEELRTLGDELGDDESLLCLLVAGDGPSFSAGLDVIEGLGGVIADIAERTDDEEAMAVGARVAGSFQWIAELGCSSVAAVHGHALGAGMQLALACDFRVFADNAKVGLIEDRYGLLPDMGATVRLPRIVGENRARELILLGEVVDAEEALRIGLANRVVPENELRTTARELAARLAAQPPLAVRGARRALDAAWYSPPAESFDVGLEGQRHCLASDDFREAQRAFVEQRSPEWKGR